MDAGRMKDQGKKSNQNGVNNLGGGSSNGGRDTDLELNDPVLTETEVHPLCLLHVEGALVQLGHGVVGVQGGHLLVHLPDDQPGQGHPGDGADQLHRRTVVDVAVPHCELFRLGFVLVHWEENITEYGEIQGKNELLKSSREKIKE